MSVPVALFLKNSNCSWTIIWSALKVLINEYNVNISKFNGPIKKCLTIYCHFIHFKHIYMYMYIYNIYIYKSDIFINMYSSDFILQWSYIVCVWEYGNIWIYTERYAPYLFYLISFGDHSVLVHIDLDLPAAWNPIVWICHNLLNNYL